MKSRPSSNGMPSVAKKPGVTDRNLPRGGLFTVFELLPFDGEREPGSEVAGVAPRHLAADGHLLHARHFADAAPHVAVERADLLGRFPERHDGHVDREDVRRLKPRLRRLQRQQGLQQHPRAGQQHERRGDLRHRKRAKAAVRRAGDAKTAGRQAQALRRIRGRESRDEREQHAGHRGERDADPQDAGSNVRSSARTEKRAA